MAFVERVRSICALSLAAAVLAGCAGGAGGRTERVASERSDGLADLELRIDVGDKAGTVYAALFANAQSYAGEEPVASGAADVEADQARFAFKDLEPGRYAVKAFLDLNADGELNVNNMGIPTEPFAFSNNAIAAFGPPSFDRAAFEVATGKTVHAMSMR